ncbi:MAG: transposase [Bacteroidetes bacterium]|nr:transposase [Bacteroidota bacterium]
MMQVLLECQFNVTRHKNIDATWVKKGGQNIYGYKQHIKADLKSKLITNYVVTTASVHDSIILPDLITKRMEAKNYMEIQHIQVKI